MCFFWCKKRRGKNEVRKKKKEEENRRRRWNDRSFFFVRPCERGKRRRRCRFIIQKSQIYPPSFSFFPFCFQLLKTPSTRSLDSCLSLGGRSIPVGGRFSRGHDALYLYKKNEGFFFLSALPWTHRRRGRLKKILQKKTRFFFPSLFFPLTRRRQGQLKKKSQCSSAQRRLCGRSSRKKAKKRMLVSLFFSSLSLSFSTSFN